MKLKFSILIFIILLSSTAFADELILPDNASLKAQEKTEISKDFATGKAVKEINLSKALSLALTQNPELSAYSHQVRANEARAIQAGLLSNPELEMESSGIGEKSSQAPLTPTDTLKINQLIELGGKRSKRSKIASYEKDLAGWDYESKRLDIITKTAKNFIDVLTAQEMAQLNRQLANLSAQVLVSVSERAASGKISPLEELKARANFASVKIEADRAGREIEAAKARLAACWGSDSVDFDKVIGNLEEISQSLPNEDMVKNFSLNPDIARWNAEIAHRQETLKLEKSKKIPDLTLSLGIQSSRGNDNSYDDKAYMAGIIIPLPVFNRNQGGIAEAECNLTKAKDDRIAGKIEIQIQISETYQRLRSAHDWAGALKKDILPAAERVFEASNEGYRLGKFGYLEVLDAQRTFFEAKRQYIEALSARHLAEIDLERLLGTNLNPDKTGFSHDKRN